MLKRKSTKYNEAKMSRMKPIMFSFAKTSLDSIMHGHEKAVKDVNPDLDFSGSGIKKKKKKRFSSRKKTRNI